MTTLDVNLTHVYDATAEEVYDAFLDAKARIQWFQDDPSREVDAETDARVGGEWWVTFGDFREHGTFVELDRPNRIVTNSVFTFPDGRTMETLLTITLVERDGKTTLTLCDAGFPDEETRSAHEGGWPGFLRRLAEVLEARR